MAISRPKFIDKWRAHSALGYFQVCCYFASVILSLLVVIPVGVTLRNFHGKCILFAQVVWDNTVIYPWAEESCDFVLYGTLAVGLVYATFMGIFTLLAVVPKTNKKPHRFGLIQAHNVKYTLLALNPVFLFIDTCTLMIMLGTALLVTSGLASFCDDLVRAMKAKGQDIGSCLESKNINWMEFRVEGGMDHGVHGGSFYGLYSIATIAAWLLVVVWTMLLIGDFSLCCRGCSCRKAAEKQRFDKSYRIAAARSRLATPALTPRSYGQVPLSQQHPGPGGPHPPPMGAHGGYSQQPLPQKY